MAVKLGQWVKTHKTAAIIGGGGLAIVGVVYWRRQAANQAGSQTAQSATGTDPNAIDPSTGMTYGQEEQAAMYGGYGGYNPFPGGGSPGGQTIIEKFYNKQPKQHETNAAWLHGAENILPNGHSPTVENALLRVLGGQSVTWAQRALFLEAVGVNGQPPEGYPKPIKIENTGGDHKPEHHHVKVPHVVGMSYTEAQATLFTHGLKARRGKGPHNTWVDHQNPDAGDEVAKGTQVFLETRNVHPAGK